jgi:Protein of unknown function (DUF642)
VTRLLAVFGSVGLLVSLPGISWASQALVTHATVSGTSFSAKTFCPTSPNGSGLLEDGDFSQARYPGPNWIVFGKGQKFAPRWKVAKETVDFVGGYFLTPNGVCSVDLDGDATNPMGSIGSIAHSPFATVSGLAYTATFLFSGNGFNAPTVKTMVVSAAGQSQQFTWDTSSGNDAEHGVFQIESWSFTAVGPTTKLKFTSLDPKKSCCGPVVAAISVTQN